MNTGALYALVGPPEVLDHHWTSRHVCFHEEFNELGELGETLRWNLPLVYPDKRIMSTRLFRLNEVSVFVLSQKLVDLDHHQRWLTPLVLSFIPSNFLFLHHPWSYTFTTTLPHVLNVDQKQVAGSTSSSFALAPPCPLEAAEIVIRTITPPETTTTSETTSSARSKT